MENISICVSFIVSLLGIAYPILFQVVSRLDERYSSQILIDLFRKELEFKFFISALKISLVSIFIWILKLPPLLKIKGLNYLIENSAQIILILTTLILVISFFYFVKKVLIYIIPTRFVPYLIEKHINEN